MSEEHEGESRAQPTSRQAPYVLAMVICDQVYTCPNTQKKTLLGTFSAIGTRELPAKIGAMCLYMLMTDGHGRTPVKVRITDVDDEREPIVELESEFIFDDPRLVVEMVLALANVVFPTDGEYRIQLYACDEFLMERRIVIVDLSKEKQHDPA